MNDIDFDELDLAVSSLIGKPGAEPEPTTQSNDAPSGSSAPAPKVSTDFVTPSSPAATVRPLAVAVTDSTRPAATSQSRPSIAPPSASSATGGGSPAPATRRTGRFMDMVHPRPASNSALSSSPAIKPAPVPQPSRVSYTGKKLEPISEATKSFLHEEKSHKPINEDEPLLAAETTSHPEVTPEKKAEKSEDTSPPLFLSGTKVEKRPLGQFSSPATEKAAETSVPPPPTHEDFFAVADVKATTEGGAPAKKTTPLPPELDQRVVAVEAGDIEASDEDDRPDTPPAYAPEPNLVTPPTKKPQSSLLHQTHSIPAQYKAKQSETDMTPRPIFDTKDYHQPLTPGAKKSGHKPWVWAVLVLALLGVGAGLGVSAYFLLG